MARRQVIRGIRRSRTADHKTVVYKSTGEHVSVEVTAPDWQVIAGRAKDARPVWARVKLNKFFDKRSRYERDDRWVGGIGRLDRDGRRRNWGKGYAPRQRITYTKRLLKLRYTRPFPPALTTATDLQIVKWLAEYIIAGDLP